MKKEVTSIMIICDGCGEHFIDGDNHVSYNNDPDGSLIESEAESSHWLTFGDRHYCPDCYSLDENDVYHTKDGKRWDANTGEEIQA